MRRRVCVVAVIAMATVALLAGPAAARETTFSETCPDVFGKNATGDLEKHTDPVPDSMVAPGQAVNVTLRWPNTVVAGDREHRVIECATTNGGAPWLWAERRLVTAEGTTSVSMTVPSGLAAGSKVCSQSILVTKGSFGPVRRWSDTTCYRVGAVEKKVMEPLMRRSPAPPDNETPTTTTEEKGRAEEEKRRKEEEEKRRREQEKRKKEEEEKKKRKVTTTTAKTEVTLPPTTVSQSPATSSTTAPAPVVAASPPPRAPLAVPSPPPPKAPITRPAAQAPSRPKGAVARPAGQLARTGTGALRLFILGGVTLVTGRLLRRVASRNQHLPRRGASPGPRIPELDPPQPAPGLGEPAGEAGAPGE